MKKLFLFLTILTLTSAFGKEHHAKIADYSDAPIIDALSKFVHKNASCPHFRFMLHRGYKPVGMRRALMKNIRPNNERKMTNYENMFLFPDGEMGLISIYNNYVVLTTIHNKDVATTTIEKYYTQNNFDILNNLANNIVCKII